MSYFNLESSSHFRLMKETKKAFSKLSNAELELNHKFVLPGEVITELPGHMRGHGTYVSENQHIASVAGVVEKINRLISVRPLRTRYNGEIGDVVVGRIIEVQQKRWKVETNSKLDSVLLLPSVNLPGGELRRKTAEDEMMMRQLLAEGDLVSAEVQNIFDDGSLSLHTRNLKYGKLGQGMLVTVSPSLVERKKIHFHNLPCGAHIILGNNGYVWISPVQSSDTQSGGFVLDTTPVSPDVRSIMSRIRNCVLALAENKVMINETSVQYAFEVSKHLNYQIKDLLLHEISAEVATFTRQKMED